MRALAGGKARVCHACEWHTTVTVQAMIRGREARPGMLNSKGIMKTANESKPRIDMVGIPAAAGRTPNRPPRARWAVVLGGLIVALLLAMAMPSRSMAALSFSAAPSASTLNYPAAVVVGYFNGDADIDFATVNAGGANVAAQLGNGAGGFAPVYPAIFVQNHPTRMAGGDFNADAYTDLVVSNAESHSVSVLRGDGAGAFTLLANYPTGQSPRGVAVADFDGDGHADFVVANSEDNSISLYHGNGLGAFSPGFTLNVGVGPDGLATADFNGDGDIDIAVANGIANTVSILLGNGSGGFFPISSPGTGDGPGSMAAADFNEDGDIDLAVANWSSNNVSILLGVGDGTFAAAAPLSVGSGPVGLATADLNQDGHADLAVSNFNDDNVSIRLGLGDGTFSVGPTQSVGDGPGDLAAQDLNHDGKPDLVVLNGPVATVSILLNTLTSSDASLSALSASGGALAPAFVPTTHGYNVFVANATASTTVTPTRNEIHATITVNGTPVASGTPSAAIPLIIGANAIAVEVTAEDGTTETYTVTVYRAPLLSNDNLVGLDLSSGVLAPSFSSLTQWYTAEVANSVTSIVVTPTAPDYAFSSITVNGTPVASGTPSGPIPLSVGLNPDIDIAVTAEDGVTTKTYHVAVTRGAVADDASLSALVLSSGPLSPAFASGMLAYAASVASGVTSVTLTPTVSAPGASVTVNGVPVASGAASGPIALNPGSNTITLVGTSPSTAKTMTYTLVVQRAAPPATPPVVGAVPNQTATLGLPFSVSLAAHVAATEGDAITAYTLTGALPPGLTFDSGTGVLSGTPVAVGTYFNLVFGASDDDGASNTDTFSLTVDPAQVQSARAVPTLGPLGVSILILTIGLTGLVASRGTLSRRFHIRNRATS